MISSTLLHPYLIFATSVYHSKHLSSLCISYLSQTLSIPIFLWYNIWSPFPHNTPTPPLPQQPQFSIPSTGSKNIKSHTHIVGSSLLTAPPRRSTTQTLLLRPPLRLSRPCYPTNPPVTHRPPSRHSQATLGVCERRHCDWGCV